MKGTILGVCFSTLPGPAGLRVFQLAIHKGTFRAIGGTFALILSEIIIILIILYVPGFQVIKKNLIFQLSSSLFLLTFGTLAFLKLKNSSLSSQYSNSAALPQGMLNPAIISFLNPAVWLGMTALVGLAPTESFGNSVSFFAGLQLGTLMWFTIIITQMQAMSDQAHRFIQKIAIFAMMVVGVWTGTQVFL